MRGHLRKRGNVWYAVVYRGRHTDTGNKQYQWIPLKGNRPDAEKELTRVLRQIDTNQYSRPSKVTVSEFLERWMSEYVAPNLSPTTYQGYEFICNRIVIPAIGKLVLSRLTSAHLQKLYTDQKARGLSGTSIKHIHTMTHRALKSAKKWGLVSQNVADAEYLELPKPDTPEMEYWSDAEMDTFLTKLKGSEYYPLFYTDLYSGMRRSELLALKWSDIDFRSGCVSISRALHQLNDRSFVTRQNKTEKSRRVIVLPPSCLDVLSEYKKANPPASLDTLIFHHKDGSPLSPTSVSHAWHRLCKQFGVKVIRLHDARHTFASRMLARGVDLKVVQELLGHSRIETTADIYTHVILDLQKDAAKRYDQKV